jgi:alkylation response protein AidB-like acyl-CoA dehydrogenase
MIGGGFLLSASTPDDVFTPEDFSEEHRAVAKTTADFFANEVAPVLDAIQHQQPGVAAGVLKKSAQLGLTAVLVPEQYGGMELDLVSAMIVAEHLARDASYSAWHGAHSGIGTLPVLLFGTEQQKRKYLPRLASGEWIGAYCLSEPHAGSDALAARTRADLNAAGTHYVLNGQKMWITNGGAADLFTVFAKVGGEHFTAFLVERSLPGVSCGAEEKKMGIKGSSTTAVYLDNVAVPVDNVLGEVGRGHIIAFNILNLGRLKLGPGTTGGAKHVLELSLDYAKQRQAFGRAIAEFGMIQHKLAEMAARTYAAETISYRVTGLIQRFSPDLLKAAEEFAAECSYVKIYASEALDYVVDEGVQIHGGYGFHQDYLVERAYRDSRINRIFEGTNEINRMLATAMLIKRAQRGRLGLVEAVKKLEASVLNPAPAATPVEGAKMAALLLIGVAYRRFLDALDEQQEVLAAITDVAMNAFVLESVTLRAAKSGAAIARLYANLIQETALRTIDDAARTVLSACAEGDTLRSHLAVLRRLTRRDSPDLIALRRQIAAKLLAAGRYLA